MSSGASYVIWSLGRDGIEDADRVGGWSTSLDSDFVLTKGKWWRWPIGMTPEPFDKKGDPFAEIRSGS